MTATTAEPQIVGSRFAQVLTPVDFSPLSWLPLSLARHLAKRFGANHHVLHVDTASPWRDENGGSLRIETAPGGQHVEVDVRAAASPADGIVSALDATSPALLVMATHGHTAAAEIVLGSTAEQVLSRWDGPIVATGPRFRAVDELRRLVVCVEPALPLPRQLLADAKAFAAALDLPVTVFGVTADSLPSEHAGQAERLNEAAAAVSRPAEPAGVATFGSGSVPGNIVDFADSTPGTLIAAAPHVRYLSTRLVMGSVALAVCRRSTSATLLRRFDAHDCDQTGCDDDGH